MNMIDYEARTQARVDEAEINTAVTFLNRQISKGKKYNMEQAMKLITENLGYRKEIAEIAFNKICNQEM